MTRFSLKLNTGGYSLYADSFRMAAQIPAVELFNSPAPVEPEFNQPYSRAGNIGSLHGTVSGAVALNDGIELRREIFMSNDCRYCGVRLIAKNRRATPVELSALYPLEISGAASLELSGDGMEHWRFLKTCRQKTDVPGAFDFVHDDENFEDAALEGGKIKAGGGVTGNQADFLNRAEICAEPFFYIKNKRHENRAGLFFGIIGQTEHLTTFTVSQVPGTSELKTIRCRCEFDGITVDPGEERTTHWMLITACDDEVMMREMFTEISMRELNIPAPARTPLNIFCTWQFYGFDFCSADLDETLSALKKRPLPIDVFQLDNGWMDKLGDYNANHRFPEGMKAVAEKIRAAGMMPGIWTCPTMIRGTADAVKKYPDLIARTRTGEPLQFDYIEGDAFAIDPTAPNYRNYMRGVYSKLLEWGFTYHKTDFLRSIILNENIQFHDRKMNRAQAYYLAGNVLREVLGDESYIVSCGGINDAANAGVYDSLRATNDMFGFWTPPDGARWKGTLIKIKQGCIRNYINHFIRFDPDACPLRRRTEPFRPGVLRDDLSLGLFTDEEAFTVALSQYTGGGNTCICERFTELDDDRRALYRHFIPALGIPARPLNYSTPRCPNFFQTDVQPRAAGVEPWWTLAAGNWNDTEKEITVDLSKCRLPEEITELAVFEFHDQRFYGIQSRGAKIVLTIPAHGMRLLRLAAWRGDAPVLLGTDFHFSGGGMEFSELTISGDLISGTVDSPWKEYPLTVHAAFPVDGGVKMSSKIISANEATFYIANE
ncbi:MAG: alpha-galactosidase [Kiritimatiellales bacterium]